jgi:hypothetical protein
MCAGFSALQWLIEGFGYDITSADVFAAYTSTMQAAEKVGEVDAGQTLSVEEYLSLGAPDNIQEWLDVIQESHEFI